MEKIIQYEKDVVFKTNISEITSISLERELRINDSIVSGKFIVSGEYKITNTSTTVEPFEYTLPLDIRLEEEFDYSGSNIDVDDFYYEVINNNILRVNIDLKLDKVKERSIIEKDTIKTNDNDLRDYEVNESKETELIDKTSVEHNNIFTNFNDQDKYVSYNIYIVREEDNINNILEKYDISEECLKKYNDLNDLKKGDKIIIPSK